MGRGLIFALLFAASKALAIDISVSVVIVPGQNGLSKDQAIEALSLAQAVFREETGINLKVARLRVRTEEQQQTLLINRGRRLRKWETYFARRGDPQLLRIAILPPIIDGGKFWIAGVANGICVYRRINPVSNVNADSYKDIIYAAIGITHELAHLIGANHDDSIPATIMHSNAFFFVAHELLHFSIKSAREIEKCTEVE